MITMMMLGIILPITSVLVIIAAPLFASAADEPHWINSVAKAHRAGLQLDIFWSQICQSEKRRDILFGEFQQWTFLFHLDRAQNVQLQAQSLIGIESAKLCAEISGGEERSVEVQLLDRFDADEQSHLQQVGKMTPAMTNDSSSYAKATKSVAIGLNEEALNAEGRESLRQMLAHEDDKQLDQMVRRMEAMARQGGVKPLPSGVLEPLLNRSGYDPRSAPAFVQNRPVEVRVGILVQSIANFQLATMDYDMDCWLRLSWRDPRLALNLSTPILINDELFLKKIWRPDVHFVNARDALFHRVTRLNFYAFVFPRGGEVFLEARLYVKPKSQLILCKYPHDSQTLRLRISSIASSNGSVRFRWFSRPSDAIRIHGQLQLPELYIAGMEKGNCESRRKTGNFSCLEARFLMKRHIGFHLWQTYVPTATCVLFSWIGVWLPEEFVEGRVFVALTVFLTLSAESSSAKETLPKVSYVKCTMLQALSVISLEHKSQELKKIVVEKAGELSAYKAALLLIDSRRFHRMARDLDTFFKVMYPVIFIIFLFIYMFVVIEGDEHKCLKKSEERWANGSSVIDDEL